MAGGKPAFLGVLTLASDWPGSDCLQLECYSSTQARDFVVLTKSFLLTGLHCYWNTGALGAVWTSFEAFQWLPFSDRLYLAELLWVIAGLLHDLSIYVICMMDLIWKVLWANVEFFWTIWVCVVRQGPTRMFEVFWSFRALLRQWSQRNKLLRRFPLWLASPSKILSQYWLGALLEILCGLL